ncbi:MAG: PKD domain-containing protein [Candidatus Bipolaricaulia bacterium]
MDDTTGRYAIRESNSTNFQLCTGLLCLSNVTPTAGFTFSPSNPTTQDTAQFTDQSIDLDGTIVSWLWDFGDAQNASQQNSTHQYANNGVYTVNLTVADNDGATGTTSQEIIITPDDVDVTSTTQTTASGTDIVDALTEANTRVTKEGDGTPRVTVVQFSDNPGLDTPLFQTFDGSFIDVHFDDVTDVTGVTIEYFYPKDVDENKVKMYWWDGNEWVVASDQIVDPTDTNSYGGKIVVTVNATTTPSLSDLIGALLAVSINELPKSTVTSPNGGERIHGTHAITWTANDPDDTQADLTIKLEYSVDGGSNWNLIVEGLSGTPSSFDWNTTSPNLQSGNQYKVRVMVTDPNSASDADESDAAFSIVSFAGLVTHGPNPVDTSAIFYVALPEDATPPPSEATLYIFDVAGVLVHQESLDLTGLAAGEFLDPPPSWDPSGLSNGVYLYIVIYEDGTRSNTGKLFIQHE